MFRLCPERRRAKMYERQIRETTMTVCKKVKQRAITLIKKMKEAAASRAGEMGNFDKYCNTSIYSTVDKIRKELHNLDTQIYEDYPAKIKTIEEQISAIDFGELKKHLPTPGLNYSIDFAGLQDSIKALEFELLEPSEEALDTAELKETPTFLMNTIEEGSETKVCIQTAVSKSGDFWLQPDFSTEIYDKLLDISHKLRQEYICSLDWTPFEPQDEALEVGALCCVLYNCDNKWYRGCVEELRSDRKSATVRYLDFGNTAFHQVSQILPYRCMVTGVPFQAMECRLAGLTEDLSHEAKWTFNDMVRDKLLNCKFVKKVTVEETGRSMWLVELKIVEPDETLLDLNQIVKDRVINPSQKEAISCRDVRLTDENLPSSFKVISTTVKPREATGEAGVDGETSSVTDGERASQASSPEPGDGEDSQTEDKGRQPPPDSLQSCGTTSQDIRNVGQGSSQDIRNILPRSQDARHDSRTSSTQSQDIRTIDGSQDIRKAPQDSRSIGGGGGGGGLSDQAASETVDECTAFLSSLGLCEPDDDPCSESPAGGDQIKLLSEKIQTEAVKAEQNILTDSICVSMENPLPYMPMVTEIESSSREFSVPVNGHEERPASWIPSGQSYTDVVRHPVGNTPEHRDPFKPPRPSVSAANREAQAVVANIIQDVVSHFCISGETEDIDAETQVPQPNAFIEDLAYELESRGSDEHSSGTTITPSDSADSQDLKAAEDKEQTSVKSLLLEEETCLPPREVSVPQYPKLSKSNSASTEDINVKESMTKPEIQDKFLGHLCGPDSEETALKRVDDELNDSDPPQLLSTSTNNVSQFESLDPALEKLEHQESAAVDSPGHDIRQALESLRPEEDVEHIQAGDHSVVNENDLLARLPQIPFTTGSRFEMYVVSDMLPHGAFYAQTNRTEAEEAIFASFAQQLLEHAVRSSTCSVVNKGEIVLAPFDNSWYRAEVEQVNPDQTVSVCFVDYGNTEITSATNLRPIPHEFLYVPRQTARCSIATFSRPSFTQTECDVFNKLTEDLMLSATVVAQGYNVLLVALSLTSGGETKDFLSVVDEEVRKSRSEHPSANSVPSLSESVIPKVKILQRNPTSQEVMGPQRSVGVPPYTPHAPPPYNQLPTAVHTNYMYYTPQMRSQNVPHGIYGQGQMITRHPAQNYPRVRGITLENHESDNRRRSQGQGYSHRGDGAMSSQLRDCSPQGTLRTGLSVSPSRLREDATPFLPGSVYISPLKSDHSLDQHIPRESLSQSQHPNHTGDHRTVVVAPDKAVDNGVDSGPVSVISEPPSNASSSVFDEDAWIEFESNKWPSCESLPVSQSRSEPRSQHSNSSQHPSSRGPSGGRRQNKPRNSKRRGDRDMRDSQRSGNSSDSSDRSDRRGVCYGCNTSGHLKKDCPQSDSRSRGPRLTKNWRN